MKDRNFILICIGALLIAYLGDKVILSRSNEVEYKNNTNILQGKIDSLKSFNIELYYYSMGLESICDTYKSSSEAWVSVDTLELLTGRKKGNTVKP